MRNTREKKKSNNTIQSCHLRDDTKYVFFFLFLFAFYPSTQLANECCTEQMIFSLPFVDISLSAVALNFDPSSA